MLYLVYSYCVCLLHVQYVFLLHKTSVYAVVI